MKKIYTLVGCALMSGVVVAQSPYSVNGPYNFSTTTKHAPGGITFTDMRDAANLYQDRVDYYTENFDAGMGAWTAAIQNGLVGFAITNVGHANDAGSSFTIPSLLSSTPTNWIVLDSDSDGSAGQDENATLTSPSIDLTALGVSGPGPYQLKLEWEQFFAEWEQSGSFDTLYVGVSNDGGVTWDETMIGNGVGREGRPNPELVSWNISPYIMDATDVKVRFRWYGNWAYGWQIDNVKIAELPDNDMTISSTFHGDYTTGYMYSQVPVGQALPLVIGADVKNIGYDPQTNIALEWEILNPSGTSIGSGTSGSLPSLSNGQNDTIWINTGITPTALGNYTINFEVVADMTDDEAANNTKDNENFWLTEYVYAADYGNPSAPFYNWAGNDDAAASIGNIYNIEAPGVIGGITALLDNNVMIEDKLIFFMLYKYDGSEFVYEAQTADYTTTPADNGEFVTLYFDAPITASANDAFLAMAAHYGGTETPGFEMGGPVLEGSVRGTDGDNTINSLISPSAPFVRMLMADFTTVEEQTLTERFDIYPNPATDALTVSLTLSQSETTVINVLDITGKVVKTINVGTVNGDKNIAVSLEEMTSGIYFIQLINADGKQVKKFVKK